MQVEDEYTDVLQNIEFTVAHFYRRHPDMTDYAVSRVYDALIDVYTAEHIGRQPRIRRQPPPLEQALFEAVQSMCEWRLGRTSEPPGESAAGAPSMGSIDMEVLILCLKRLRKSVPKWTKRGGRQGYLNFMSQFIT